MWLVIRHLLCFALAVLLHLLVLLLAGRHLAERAKEFLPELEVASVELTLEGPAPEAPAAAARRAAPEPAPHPEPAALPEPPRDLAPLPEVTPLPAPESLPPQPEPRPLPEPARAPVRELPEPEARPAEAEPGPQAEVAEAGIPEQGGGAAGQVIAHPTLERTIRPVYPIGARRRGEEGTVILDVTVGPDGRAVAVTRVASSGFPELDRAAERAAAQARFRPGTRDGKPVASAARLTLIFRLRDR
ncbi:MAG: energy transducer TonB [Kiritimatiellia bacterium]|jgi:protein TonB|nr:energy transducer TonB [Kiritimatiellia bacterium]